MKNLITFFLLLTSLISFGQFRTHLRHPALILREPIQVIEHRTPPLGYNYQFPGTTSTTNQPVIERTWRQVQFNLLPHDHRLQAATMYDRRGRLTDSYPAFELHRLRRHY